MNIEDFNGFLKFKDEIYPFSFKDNEVTIHPYSIDKWNEFRAEWFHFDFGKKNKWLDKIVLEGVTDKKKAVYFYVTDNPKYCYGYYTYKVEFMYISDINPETDEVYDIKGIRFKGPEINYLYNVRDYIKQDFETKNDIFDRFNMELKSKKDNNFGNFRWHNYSIAIKGSFSWEKANDTYEPIKINALLVLELSRTSSNLKELIELILIQKKVLYFSCYRKNITFNEIDTYTYERNARKKVGNFYIFDSEITPEESRKVLKQIIDYKNVGSNVSELYKLEIKKKLYTTHICANYREKHIYTPARILSIVIAFEHYFKIIYPTCLISSSDYETVRKDTITFLDEKIKESSGSIRKKYKGMKNSVSKLGESYGQHLKYALEENYDILEPFIRYFYKVKNPKQILKACSERVNTIRNSMAHGKLDIKYKPINTNDIHLVEILLYSMVLKSIEISNEKIQQEIKRIFDISI